MADPQLKENENKKISPDPKFTKEEQIGRSIQGVAFGASKTGVIRALNEKSLAGVNFGINDGLADQAELTSYLGTPIYDTVSLGFINKKDRNNYIDEFGNTVYFEPIRLVEVLVNIQLTKNIVTTPIAGRDGTVKQYISNGDYMITINGRVSGQYNPNNDEFRETNSIFQFQQSIDKLVNVCNIGYAIPITSRFLERFFINKVVITDYSMPQIEGVRNYQPFTINMLSDNEDRLIFTEEEINDDDLLNNIFNNA